jgi:hypothetical protein
LIDVLVQADQRFTEPQLQDILARITRVFDEEEADIPAGVEDVEMPKVENKLLGAARKRKVKRRKREE